MQDKRYSSILLQGVPIMAFTELKAIGKKKEASMTAMLSKCVYEIVKAHEGEDYSDAGDDTEEIHINKIPTASKRRLKEIADAHGLTIAALLKPCIFEIIRAHKGIDYSTPCSTVEIKINSIPADIKLRLQQIANAQGLNMSTLLKPCIFTINKQNRHLLK